MSLPTTIFVPQPAIINLSPKSSSSSSQLKSLKPFSINRFPISNQASSATYGFNRGLSRKSRTMRASETHIEASGSGDGEQEGLLGGSADLGFGAALNRQSKWIVSGLFVAAILGRHDTKAMWFAIGSVLNVIASIKLKRLLKQERPLSNLRSDHGMPSSHAQSIFFNFTFVIGFFLERLGINGITVLTAASGLAFAWYISWLRVSHKLHTMSQIVVGAVLGLTFSVFWNWLWSAVVMQALESFLWVRVLVCLSAVTFSIGFLLYVFGYWRRGEL